MTKEEYTTSTSSTDTLSIKDINRAVETLKNAESTPVVTCLESKWEVRELIGKSYIARGYILYRGVPCYTNKKVSKGKVRFHFSNGTTEDVDISSKPDYLPTK